MGPGVTPQRAQRGDSPPRQRARACWEPGSLPEQVARDVCGSVLQTWKDSSLKSGKGTLGREEGVSDVSGRGGEPGVFPEPRGGQRRCGNGRRQRGLQP